ncbi:MAG TPA: hypothetical protein IGS17_18745 [Oscillatoriales cyanobacterium M59_W2019_021]|nr:hypothetical protein [Oscillatoriales cyanobacterium M4454_W2019_049]HIK52935.1 hypothetical protein [Oscillatoriales cyanobacterium M59_W2019_021]
MPDLLSRSDLDRTLQKISIAIGTRHSARIANTLVPVGLEMVGFSSFRDSSGVAVRMNAATW